MKYEDFIRYVREKVQKQMGATVNVELRCVTKNNGIELFGLAITREGERIAPMIYLDDFYEAYEGGLSVPDIVATIMKAYDKAKVSLPFDSDFYMDYDNIQDRIACKLINYRKNRELLKKVPFIKCLDLAIVFYYMVKSEKIGDGTILIYNSHLKMWNVTKEEVYETARKNTADLLPHEFQGMSQMLEEALGNHYIPPKNTIPMFILSNEKKYLGAATILYDSILAEIAERLDDDFFVLPSSVHEVIVVPADIRATKAELCSMVKEINATQVDPGEVLSDNVYYYERKSHKLSL